jgi:hypothetical protein
MGGIHHRSTRARVPAAVWCIAAIVAAVLIANLPYVLGIFASDQIARLSGLAVHVQPGLLRGAPTIDPNIGFTAQALGRRAALDWIHGHVPWWNPFEGAGTPLAGGMQSAAFFPPTLLLLLHNGQLYFHIVLEITGGIGAWFLLRRLGLRDWLATAGGIAFALNGTFAWFGNAAVNPVAFVPWLVAGVEEAYQRAHEPDRRSPRIIGAAIALSIVAGFPETAFIGALFAAGWAVLRFASLPAGSRALFARRTGAGACIGALLAAPALLAFATYLPNALVGGHFGALARGHLPARAIASAVMPYFFGTIFRSPSHMVGLLWGHIGGYATSALLFAALVAVFAKRRRAERFYLAGWALAALLITYGIPTSFGPVLGRIPLLRNTAFFRYAPPAWELAIVILAVMGLDEIVRSPSIQTRLVPAAAVTIAVVGVSVAVTPPIEQELLRRDPMHMGLVSLAWACATVLVMLGAALLLRSHARAAVVAAVFLLDVGAMFLLPQFSANRAVKMDTAPVAYLQRHLGLARFATLGPIQPNYGSYWGLASVNENDLPLPRDWARYVHENLDSWVNPVVFIGVQAARPRGAMSPVDEVLTHLDGYQRAGVAYIVAPRRLAIEDARLHRVFTSRTSAIYRVDDARPYVEVRDARCLATASAREHVIVTCPHSSTIVRRELYMPGWNARLDGRPVRVRRSGAFQAVDVPAGRSDLTFSFSPPGMPVAVAAFAIGVLLTVPLRRRSAAETLPIAADPADSVPVPSP